MLLSVCIVNWNTRDYLRECLASLYAHPPRGSEMEVLVVDNASHDGSAEMVARDFPQAVLMANSDNKGYADGNNQAFSRSGGDYVLLLNPDVVVDKDSLTRSLLFMRSHPTVGALGCRLIGKDGHTQRSLRGFPDPAPVLYDFLGFSRLFPHSKRFGAYRMTYYDYDRPGEVDQPMGSFLLIPRKTLDEVGMLDSNFPIFFNEVDWCYRAKREMGWSIYYTPEISVVHYGGSSTKQVKARMIRESHQSLLRFYEKHYKDKINPFVFWIIKRAVLMHQRKQLRAAKPETTRSST